LAFSHQLLPYVALFRRTHRCHPRACPEDPWFRKYGKLVVWLRSSNQEAEVNPYLLGTPLSKEEERDILSRLTDENLPPLTTANLILRLGRTGDTKYEGIIRPFLDLHDPDIAAAALRSLVRHFDRVAEHGAKLKEFVRGVAWDIDGGLRLEAIQLSSDFLQLQKDPELARLILAIFDQAEDDENPFKQAGYAALAAFLDRDRRSLAKSVETALVFDIDYHLINEVRARLTRSERT
jgi:hypothetical protein